VVAETAWCKAWQKKTLLRTAPKHALQVLSMNEHGKKCDEEQLSRPSIRARRQKHTRNGGQVLKEILVQIRPLHKHPFVVKRVRENTADERLHRSSRNMYMTALTLGRVFCRPRPHY
jgi:hypothetical protein